ncbi:MAG: hypothetical protein IH596_08080 [Bacteroidales bacterium]|nr:hypothetical protein [Bacteroidales bacterium]
MCRSISLKCIVIVTYIAILFPHTLSLQAQTQQPLAAVEEELSALFDSINATAGDEERLSLGLQYSSMLHNALILDGSFEHPFPLLPYLSKLTSPDERFRIFTWNIPLHSGMNKFYGIIQLKPDKTDSLAVVDLVDQIDGIEDPDHQVLSPEKWFGAVYYKLIPHQTVHGQVFYTLLGWRGENMLMTSRLIDVLAFLPENEIRFGKKVFCDFAEVKPTRILFRHSANVTMSLRYEEQSVVISKKWNARRKEFIYTNERAWMIVSDRLIPANPQLEGQFEYYIPAGDVMDGFLFRDGCWNFIQEIDARNPEIK